MDMQSIKNKLDRLLSQGEGSSNSRTNRFKISAGETKTVRIVPIPGEEDPFKEFYFYYQIGRRTIFSPKNLDPEAFCPIDELRIKLFQEGDDESKELAKKLFPKLRPHVPVIVRGEEEQGPKWWGFGVTVYQELLEKWLDAENFGPLSNLEDGFDIEVSSKKEARRPFPVITAKPVSNPSPLIGKKKKVDGKMQVVLDEKKAEEIMNNIPSLEDTFNIYSNEEIERFLKEWLSMGSDQELGTEKSSEEDPFDKKLAELQKDLEEKLEDDDS